MDVNKINEILRIIDLFNSEDNPEQQQMTHVDACLKIEKVLRQ